MNCAGPYLKVVLKPISYLTQLVFEQKPREDNMLTMWKQRPSVDIYYL